MKSIHISEVPPELIKVRDRWRHFWFWIPVLGYLYRRFVYIRKWNQWSEENHIMMINHNPRP